MRKFLTACGLSLVVLSCGVDPDDYAPAEPDGCKSSDTDCQAKVEEEEEEEDSEEEVDGIVINNEINIGVGDTIDNPTAAYEGCEVGLLCRGMSKREVASILGRPDSIDVHRDGVHEAWKWSVLSDGMCAPYSSCALIFKQGHLEDQVDMNADWIDVFNW